MTFGSHINNGSRQEFCSSDGSAECLSEFCDVVLRPNRLARFATIVVALLGIARADVVVVDNRTTQPINISVQASGALPEPLRLAAGECRPLFVDTPPTLTYSTGQQQVQQLLRLQSAYFFATTPTGEMRLIPIGLGDQSQPATARPLPGSAHGPAAMIPVKVLVDEEETARRPNWERRLRDRVDAASRIMQAHTGVGFTVLATGEWMTDDRNNDFNETLRQFEKAVPAHPAQLAIGFSSQYEVVKGRVHLGGTRGPLSSHILMREWSVHVSENERLELLVHELGHLLGAAHSPEADSVMRPVLGDRKARRNDFTIRFDPVNTLVMAMAGEEIRRRRIVSFDALTNPTRHRLAEIYRAIAPTQPKDKSATLLAARLGPISRTVARPTSSDAQAAAAKPNREADEVEAIMLAIVTAARTNKQSVAPVDGDKLLDNYLRTARDAASHLPAEVRRERMLAGLLLAIDTKDEFIIISELKDLASQTGAQSNSVVRRAFIGSPTLAGRPDTLKHFLLSAYLAEKRGADAAEALGIAKEFADSRPGGSGFSFADLAADLAGIRFAQQLKVDPQHLIGRGDELSAADYVPELSNLAEGISLRDAVIKYGGPGDARLQNEIDRLKESVEKLDVYQQTP